MRRATLAGEALERVSEETNTSISTAYIAPMSGSLFILRKYRRRTKEREGRRRRDHQIAKKEIEQRGRIHELLPRRCSWPTND